LKRGRELAVTVRNSNEVRPNRGIDNLGETLQIKPL
jgi:hypothetical protein